MKNAVIKVLLLNEKGQISVLEKLSKTEKKLYKITRVTSVEEVEKKIVTEKFDLIIIDYSIDTADIYNIFKNSKNVPTFIIAANTEIVFKAIKAGACEYLIKDSEENYLKILPVLIEKAINNFKISNLSTDAANAKIERNESEYKYRSLIENAPVGIFLADTNGNIIDINPTLLKILGSPSFEASKKINLLTFPSLVDSGFSDDFIRCAKTGELINKEIPYISSWGKSTYLCYHLTSIYNESNEIYRIQAQIEDISERKKAEIDIRESELLYRTLARNLPDFAVLLYDQQLRYKIAEGTALNLPDLSKYEGKTIWDVLPQESIVQLEPYYRASLEGKTTIFEKQFGEEIYLTHMLPVRNEKQQIFAGMVVYRNITLQKATEEKIKASLKEKELLLKEVHHRVKNNLQVVSSLLSLQAGYIKDKHVSELFKESQNRIRAMALIHEKLYQTKNLASINFEQYATSLTNYLYQSYGFSEKSIAFKIETSNIYLDIETAIPLGLIVNELVSNSLKYAFGTKNSGEIYIYLYNINNKYELIIGDNGIGIAENIDFRNTPSLGLQLIVNLTEQLEGTIELNRENGTRFKIIFEELKYKERY